MALITDKLFGGNIGLIGLIFFLVFDGFGGTSF